MSLTTLFFEPSLIELRMARNGTILLIAALLTITGCGTMKNLSNEPHQAPDPVLVPQTVYGGVRCDLAYASFWTFYLCNPLVGACWLADIPLSAVADTLTLPMTYPNGLEAWQL